MRLLVLGAGTYQCELIQEAKAYGEVSAISNSHSDIGFAYADKKEVISILDYEACLRVANHLSVSSIISSGSQLAAYTQAQLNATLGLNGFPFEFVKVMTNKLLMREWLALKTDAKVRYTTDISKIDDSLSWLVKPLIASGSKGIELYSKQTTKLETIANSSFFVTGWLAEEFLQGETGSALFCVEKGKSKRLLSTKKVINADFVPLAHVITDYADWVNAELDEIIEIMISDYDLDTGFVDLDFIITENKIEVVDVGTRLSGNGLVELYNLLSKQNLYKEQVKMSLGIPLIELPLLHTNNKGLILYYATNKGVLDSYKERFDEVNIILKKKFVALGTDVKALTEGKNQLGFFIFETGENVFNKVLEITKQSTVVLE